MKILLTGASSFTGYWIARALHQAGHHVVATLRGAPQGYDGVRGERVRRLADCAEIVPDCVFGEARFLDLVQAGGWDLLCHHAANVTNYRSPDFDAAGALAENTRNLPAILRRLADQGSRGVVLTGSVFEQNEGAGTQPLHAFSPYGLSKGLTDQTFRYWTAAIGMPMGKFVIPNPFGPFEEPRFCAYLLKCWSKGETASVKTPLYVRDNIHVDLLALSYAAFCADLPETPGFHRRNVSGYVESQGAFAVRYAAELRSRVGLDCRVELMEQTDFSEPMVRINTDRVDAAPLGWSEKDAWDAIAAYCREFGLLA